MRRSPVKSPAFLSFDARGLPTPKFSSAAKPKGSGIAADDHPVPLPDADSDQNSDPSNLNWSNLPSICCDLEKSCLTP
ncbi:hypothetical protein DITRI_Ditri20bG0122000 [Diplodiscus trichospermus]